MFPLHPPHPPPHLFCLQPLRLLNLLSIRRSEGEGGGGGRGGGGDKKKSQIDTLSHILLPARWGEDAIVHAHAYFVRARIQHRAPTEPPGSCKSMEAGWISAALIKGSLSMCLAGCSPQDGSWRVERRRSVCAVRVCVC